jgi:Sugar-specific transcriptional regulator TrmB
MERSPRDPLTGSVMEELQRLLDAAVAFETGVARHYGLNRADMRWFTALGAAENGMTATEIAAAADRSLTDVDQALRRLRELGHVKLAAGAEERVALAPAAKALLVDAYAPVETAYVGLYRYNAAELRVVRTFLRIGREFYERQTVRFERHKARLTSTGAEPPSAD